PIVEWTIRLDVSNKKCKLQNRNCKLNMKCQLLRLQFSIPILQFAIARSRRTGVSVPRILLPAAYWRQPTLGGEGLLELFELALHDLHVGHESDGLALRFDGLL